jgi:uncharacterized protein (TIGR02246 family)
MAAIRRISHKESAMTFNRFKIVAAVLIVTSLPLTASWAKPADSNEADSASIKKLFADFNNAFNSHDAHAAAMQFTDDGEFITVAAATSRGKAEIEQHLAPLFGDRLKAAHRDVSLRGVRFLGPDTATIDSDFVMTGLTGPNGAIPPIKGFYDWIVMKQNGRWLIAVWHESNLPVAPPAPPK